MKLKFVEEELLDASVGEFKLQENQHKTVDETKDRLATSDV